MGRKSGANFVIRNYYPCDKISEIDLNDEFQKDRRRTNEINV